MNKRIFTSGDQESELLIDQEFVLPELGDDAGSVAVFDTNTARLFGKDSHEPVVIAPGESSKSWGSVQAIIEEALKRGLGRDSFFVGIGGGVVCDVTAFAASIYMRGSKLALVPTTLLSMVDAALGGKTAINFAGYKNMVGSFYPAQKIYLYTRTLGSLPERDYMSGLAEVIKTALLGDEELFEILVNQKEAVLGRDPGLLQKIIDRCNVVKSSVIGDDLRDTGRRNILNLGHTFGHALEAVKDFEGWTHGEAVAWGICRAMDLGVELGHTDMSYAEQVKSVIKGYGLRTSAENIDPHVILEAMRKDKKRLRGTLRVVLQKKLGETFTIEIDEAQLVGVLGR